MFLLRCAFWLSVVYAAMFFGLPGEAGRRDAAAVSPVRGEQAALDAGQLGRAIVTRAVTGTAGPCGGRELLCARDAVRLTALVRTALAGEPDYATGSVAGATERSPTRAEARQVAGDIAGDRDAPMPAPAPRRRRIPTRQP